MNALSCNRRFQQLKSPKPRYSYVLFLSLFFLLFLISVSLSAQPVVEWQKAFGGSLNEELNSAQQTADGGYILAGQSDSGISGNRTEASRGSTDYWLVKTSADGTLEWEKRYGGSWIDGSVRVKQTPDGGYILVGDSASDAGGDKTEDNNSTSDQDGVRYPDFWVVKVSADGTKEWDRDFGGTGEELVSSIELTTDGGFLAWGTGYRASYIVKIAANGDKEWERFTGNFSGNIGRDRFGRVQTQDGGFILGTGVTGGYSVTKLASNGSQEWVKTYISSGTGSDASVGFIKMTSDGEYVVGGGSNYGIGGDKTEASKGGYDVWIVKISADGTKIWDKSFGGDGSDGANEAVETPDGGFLVLSTTTSGVSGDVSEPNTGEYNGWVVKIRQNGSIEWDRTLGGTGGRGGLSFLRQTSDGSYLLGGNATGTASEDKSEDLAGYWMIKLGPDGVKIWDKTIAGSGTPVPTADGGYLLVRSGRPTDTHGGLDYWPIKLSLNEDAMPVTLTQFTAKKENTTALLTWTTTSETRSDRFEIQRSNNGKSWNVLGIVNAKGESTDLANYQYVDTNPVMGSENLYRLKMIDTDGTFAFSKINSLTFDADILVNIFPNPAAETLTLQMSDWSKVKGVEVVNSQGNLVYQSRTKPLQYINAKGFAKGVYFVKISLNNGSNATHKIVIGH